ncbi:MAG: anacyclamide/piricyclamide family prenylated cyclic peptide [Microcoleus sp.]
MKKKNIRPQQTAPVQRETTACGATTTNDAAMLSWFTADYYYLPPFAGDDAE